MMGLRLPSPQYVILVIRYKKAGIRLLAALDAQSKRADSSSSMIQLQRTTPVDGGWKIPLHQLERVFVTCNITLPRSEL